MIPQPMNTYTTPVISVPMNSAERRSPRSVCQCIGSYFPSEPSPLTRTVILP